VDLRHGGAPRGLGDYGPLYPAGSELALPEGFAYRVIGREGALMTGGAPTPRAHDGMAAFGRRDGLVRLVRNHEDRAPAALSTAIGDPDAAYDPAAGGGATVLDVRIAPDGEVELVRDFVALGGTAVNCAGGPTPWGTWLSCEETTEGAVQGRDREHGYVFEVPAAAEGPVDPVPLRAMGRFVHEAVAADPATGIVYQTEDHPTAGFYRFLPREPGQLAEGGELQMLGLVGAIGFDTRIGQRIGARFPVRWIPIADPDPDDAVHDPLAVARQGWAGGAATFGRLEGAWWGDGGAYFISTDGGNAGYGQVWHYRPEAGDAEAREDEAAGELTLVYESPATGILANPDNVVVSPRGGILLCEDPDVAPVYLRGLAPDGTVFDFGRNLLNDREFAGACFSPDGRVLFVNLQGDTAPGGPGNPGMTFAIWGPWEDGAL
jgi:hypothetical protein